MEYVGEFRAKIFVTVGLILAATWAYAQQNIAINDKDMVVSAFEDIEYPPLARVSRTQGVVAIRVKLDTHGKVVDAEPLSGAELLIPASMANARKWKFQPNSRNAAVIIYNFRMPGAACSSRTWSFSFLQSPNFVTVTGCEVPINTQAGSK